MSLDGKTFISATEGWDPKQQGKWAFKKKETQPVQPNQEEKSGVFSREKFKAEFDSLEADYDQRSEKDTRFDPSVWVRSNGSALLPLLESRPKDREQIESAIRSRSCSTFFEIADRILRETV